VVRAALHRPALDLRPLRRVQPLLIAIGSDTAPMLARSDRPDTMPLHKNPCWQMSVIGKTGHASRHRVSVARDLGCVKTQKTEMRRE